jgi:ubiquitin C-terminal hydrolase
VQNHMGNLTGGHYTAYGKNSIDSQWYLFNDTSTVLVSEASIVTENAYILVYLRRGTEDAPPAGASAKYCAVPGR